ncbi:TolC family protein [Telmatospirillum siberiense]|uniref:TolC family protein n=1 Tax=Telmatospirillum siberiense TaxID=382514 RepID=A0A2N3Q140_9PROT|nr:TolC family protein [Telmatospirillum siberiense]PKU26376.1 TolC family protein [Telmatospirillum siberiense]
MNSQRQPWRAHGSAMPIAACIISFFLAGCAGPRDISAISGRQTPERPSIPSPGPQSPAPKADLQEYADILPSGSDPTGPLTLRRALAQALVGSPELAAYSYEIRAAEARTLQADYLPNPTLNLDSEDFGGRGTRRGFDGSASTLSFSQLIELGGKRSHRVRAAQWDESLAAWDYEAKRLDTLLETNRAFIGLLAGQQKLELAEKALMLDQQVHATVVERVRAGRVSPQEEQRSQVAVGKATVTANRARREVSNARERLATLWGGKAARFDKAVGDLSAISPPPSQEEMLAAVSQNPDMARWKAELESRRAKLDVEKSKDIPDPTISAGVRRYGDDRSTAFIAGISFPLPVFGLNQGNVLDAQQKLAKGYAEQKGAETRIVGAVKEGFERLSSAYDETTSLTHDVLPAASSAFEGAREGYRQGKFALIDVLDSQRILTEAQDRLVDAMAEYQTAKAEIERLIGGPTGPTRFSTNVDSGEVK